LKSILTALLLATLPLGGAATANAAVSPVAPADSARKTAVVQGDAVAPVNSDAAKVDAVAAKADAHEMDSAKAHGKAAESHEAGLSAKAVPLFKLGPLVVTNSMVVIWVVALGIIFLAQMATKGAQLVPSGLQNFVEWMVGSLFEFFEGILGAHMAKKTFWFFASIFIFILFTNWFGLLPGVGTIGWGSHADGSFILPKFHHVEEPLLRGGNADLNMTSAMALLFFLLWVVWSIQEIGVVGFLKHIFGDGKGGIFMVGIMLFVGVLEVISIAFRPVSLSFRLYGNVFAGENILESMTTLVPWLGWALPIPFYFLELLVGLVQALVFALLTAVFTAMMVGDHAHGEEHGEHH